MLLVAKRHIVHAAILYVSAIELFDPNPISGCYDTRLIHKILDVGLPWLSLCIGPVLRGDVHLSELEVSSRQITISLECLPDDPASFRIQFFEKVRVLFTLGNGVFEREQHQAIPKCLIAEPSCQSERMV